MSDQDLDARVESIPWFHSIDLGGVTTRGTKTAAQLAHELSRLELPHLTGKSVLDIGAWDGFFSFEAERRGAHRVVSLDHFVWALDLGPHGAEWRQLRDEGVAPPLPEHSSHWKPEGLPGKRGYDTAHQILKSHVETVVGEFMTMDLQQLGTFDVVLYLGVLYHIENPLEALRRVAAVTADMAIIETEAVEFQWSGRGSLCEFFESNEMNHDVSNWWAPNIRALQGMCRAAGFREVRAVIGPPSWSRSFAHSIRARIRREHHGYQRLGGPVRRYRAVIHAFK